MAKYLRTYHTARTHKFCNADAWVCRRIISPGEQYLRVAIPPGSDLGNEHWWVMKICKSCMTPEEKTGA